jgi:hypothetical protein
MKRGSRSAALAAVATAVVGFGAAATVPAAAETVGEVTVGEVTAAAECLGPWQYNSVGSNRAMESCITGWGTGTFTAQTAVISTSFWTGFHGCVRLEYLNASGVVVHRSTEQRWGVNAGHTRVIGWSGTGPVDYSLRTRFAHRRC